MTKCSDRQSASVGIVVILLSAKFPNLPTILFTSCGATVLLLYMVIAITHLANRYRNRHAEDQLEVKMWLFPYLTIATIIFIGFVLMSMAFIAGHRTEFFFTIGVSMVIVVTGIVVQLRHARRESTARQLEASTADAAPDPAA